MVNHIITPVHDGIVIRSVELSSGKEVEFHLTSLLLERSRFPAEYMNEVLSNNERKLKGAENGA